jgi:hypothetical protein
MNSTNFILRLVVITAVGGWVMAQIIQFFANGWKWKINTHVLENAQRARRRVEFCYLLLGCYGMIAFGLFIGLRT